MCSRCHEDAASLHPRTAVTAEADCAGCHLPTERDAFAGTPFTNHWIRLSANSPAPGSREARTDLTWLERLYRTRVEEIHPPMKAARLRLGLAELLHIRGARVEAQRLMAEALELGPDYEGRLKAAALYRDDGRIAEATPILRAALEAEPGIPHAFYELGDLLAATGSFAEAVPLLERAIELSPESAELQAGLGSARLGAGDPDAAVTAFRAALSLDPSNPNALGPLVGILAAHPQRDLRNPGDAVRLAERLAGQFSFQEPRSLDLLGAAYAARGELRRTQSRRRNAPRRWPPTAARATSPRPSASVSRSTAAHARTWAPFPELVNRDPGGRVHSGAQQSRMVDVTEAGYTAAPGWQR